MMNKLSRDLEKLEADITALMEKHRVSDDHLDPVSGQYYMDELAIARDRVHRKFIEAIIEEGMKEND